jgi:hypothetical protein
MVRLERAISVIHMAEIWTTTPEAVSGEVQYAADDPARGEAILVTCISADKGRVSCVTPFRRARRNDYLRPKRIHGVKSADNARLHPASFRAAGRAAMTTHLHNYAEVR